MTQELKDKALELLNRCECNEHKLTLPEEQIDTEVWSNVKDALKAVGGQYNQKTKVFVFEGPASQGYLNAADWLKQQDVVTYDAPALYDGPIEVEAEEEDTEPEEEQKPKHSTRERRTLRYDFSATEIHDLAVQLAHKNKEVTSLEEEKASVVAQYASKIKEGKATLGKLSNLVAEGYEFRDIEVEIFYHQPEAGKKTIIRQDSGKAIVERMEHWEYNLFTQPVDETYAEEAI